jgi:hypothetical protein
MKHPEILITKASGETQLFSEQKLRSSLLKSGASDEMVDVIIEELKPRLYKGVSTKKIYRWAFDLLKGRSKHLAAKYNLKRAIMELGPSGFPFEKYVAELLTQIGYQTKTGVIVKGKCVNHEVDVVAEKGDHHFMVECKYHNQSGTVSDVKIPLYIQARFQDVEDSWKKIPGHFTKFHQGWVVTNTKFTRDAITYASCVGLRLIGWNYPIKESLKDLIDDLAVYPITCLTTLKKSEKVLLLEKNIILCKELIHHESFLSAIGINAVRIQAILSESMQLCSRNKTASVTQK